MATEMNIETVKAYIRANPGKTGREIAKAHGWDKTELNRTILYRNKHIFQATDWKWTLVPETPVAPVVTTPPVVPVVEPVMCAVCHDTPEHDYQLIAFGCCREGKICKSCFPAMDRTNCPVCVTEIPFKRRVARMLHRVNVAEAATVAP